MLEEISELDLLSSADSQYWAKAFINIFGDHREDISQELMAGWFANAIQAGKALANNEPNAHEISNLFDLFEKDLGAVDACEPTDTELKILNASDQEIELLNRKVAAIAGWTDIKVWDSKNPKKTLIGTNLAHPEMGIFVPNYVGSLDAIAKVLNQFKINWTVSADGDSFSLLEGKKGLDHETCGATPAIALCKLLIAINPEPIKPVPKKEEVIEETESNLVEATFS